MIPTAQKVIPDIEHLELSRILNQLRLNACELLNSEGIECSPDELKRMFSPAILRNIMIRNEYHLRKMKGESYYEITSDFCERFKLTDESLRTIIYRK